MEKLNKREIYFISLSVVLLFAIVLMISTDSNCDVAEPIVELNDTEVVENITEIEEPLACCGYNDSDCICLDDNFTMVNITE